MSRMSQCFLECANAAPRWCVYSPIPNIFQVHNVFIAFSLCLCIIEVKHGNQSIYKICTSYELFFDMKIVDQNKSWAPRVVCDTFRSNLEGSIPHIRKEPQNHVNDFYNCIVDISRFSFFLNQHNITHPSILSSIAKFYTLKNYLSRLKI